VEESSVDFGGLSAIRFFFLQFGQLMVLPAASSGSLIGVLQNEQLTVNTGGLGRASGGGATSFYSFRLPWHPDAAAVTRFNCRIAEPKRFSRRRENEVVAWRGKVSKTAVSLATRSNVCSLRACYSATEHDEGGFGKAMGLKRVIRKFIEMTGYTIVAVPASPVVADAGVASAEVAAYDQDGLWSIHNHEFMQDPAFCKAYERGCRAASFDAHWHWRVHIGLWAAYIASKLAGDFVECGVNRGFLSSAIMEFLDWDSLGKTFYLLDTFAGLDPRYVAPEDCRGDALSMNEFRLKSGRQVRDVESVRANFSCWKNTRIVQGSIPETLSQVETPVVAYLHLDMNCSPPEVAALTFFWDRLVAGAVVFLDDHAYWGYESQKYALDAFAKLKNVMIASLPTGQGLLVKPTKRLSPNAA
jgi:hypothetical protein